MVAARFERHVQRTALGVRAGGSKGVDLGMRTAEAFMTAQPDHSPRAYHHGARHGVRFDGAAAQLGLGQSQVHPFQVGGARDG